MKISFILDLKFGHFQSTQQPKERNELMIRSSTILCEQKVSDSEHIL